MFIDTSGLMCLFDLRDARHVDATKYYDTATRRLLHNYVIAEFVGLTIARRSPRVEAIKFMNAIGVSEEIEFIWVGKDLHDRGLALLTQRNDKAWSLCDAVSFIAMEERGITEALTTDHHFDQAGFIRLLHR